MFRVLLLAVCVMFTSFAAEADAGDSSCVSCHTSRDKMTQLGFSHFTITSAEVTAQSGMDADCVDCHLGNTTADDKVAAHDGIGRLIVVRKKGLTGQILERRYPLEFTGNLQERFKVMVEKDSVPAVDTTISHLLYSDKRPDTLSQNFSLLRKTCGKCHAKEFSSFSSSTMARNSKQSSYLGWTDKEHGPHNCGVWFGDNQPSIARATRVPFTPEAAGVNQRTCNTCHVGCLDCHYYPQPVNPAQPKEGVHTFYRQPRPVSCYGGGRGTTCHAGPEERRRGAGYFGGTFSFPEGAEPDVHAKKGIGCFDCHENRSSNPQLPHAMVKRQGICINCHQALQISHARSVHRNLACEACHIQEVGGYQGTFWGPGKLAGVSTPFFKYKDYYGIMKQPILIRDQKGRWIPVKPIPMAVMNQKTANFKPGLHWRWPKQLPDLGRTDDAWGYVGILGGLPENNQALLWVQLDKLSHKYGPSRSCASCHELPNNEQQQTVRWEYSDQGALPFEGSHTVIGTKKGLFIRNIRASETVEPLEGQPLSAFAPWSFWPDSWGVKGDFSLPPLKNRKIYEAVKVNIVKAKKERVVH